MRKCPKIIIIPDNNICMFRREVLEGEGVWALYAGARPGPRRRRASALFGLTLPTEVEGMA